MTDNKNNGSMDRQVATSYIDWLFSKYGGCILVLSDTTEIYLKDGELSVGLKSRYVVESLDQFGLWLTREGDSVCGGVNTITHIRPPTPEGVGGDLAILLDNAQILELVGIFNGFGIDGSKLLLQFTDGSVEYEVIPDVVVSYILTQSMSGGVKYVGGEEAVLQLGFCSPAEIADAGVSEPVGKPSVISDGQKTITELVLATVFKNIDYACTLTNTAGGDSPVLHGQEMLRVLLLGVPSGVVVVNSLTPSELRLSVTEDIGHGNIGAGEYTAAPYEDLDLGEVIASVMDSDRTQDIDIGICDDIVVGINFGNSTVVDDDLPSGGHCVGGVDMVIKYLDTMPETTCCVVSNDGVLGPHTHTLTVIEKDKLLAVLVRLAGGGASVRSAISGFSYSDGDSIVFDIDTPEVSELYEILCISATHVSVKLFPHTEELPSDDPDNTTATLRMYLDHAGDKPGGVPVIPIVLDLDTVRQTLTGNTSNALVVLDSISPDTLVDGSVVGQRVENTEHTITAACGVGTDTVGRPGRTTHHADSDKIDKDVLVKYCTYHGVGDTFMEGLLETYAESKTFSFDLLHRLVEEHLTTPAGKEAKLKHKYKGVHGKLLKRAEKAMNNPSATRVYFHLSPSSAAEVMTNYVIGFIEDNYMDYKPGKLTLVTALSVIRNVGDIHTWGDVGSVVAYTIEAVEESIIRHLHNVLGSRVTEVPFIEMLLYIRRLRNSVQ